MTRKDYVKIAEILRVFDRMEQSDSDSRGNYDLSHDWLAAEFADMLARDNPRFNRDKFLEAATYKPKN